MITNYRNSLGQISLIDSAGLSDPKLVFTSSTTGAPVNPPSVTEQVNAVTTMILCNTGAPNLTDESVNTVSVNVYLVSNGQSPVLANTIISNLIIPAGETVFLSEERVVLNKGDEIFVSATVPGLLAVTVSTLPV
jgi:hypothetical protein